MAYRDNHPDLLPVVLKRARAQPTPYIVENVEGTQKLMCNPIFLCGTMFGLNIWRHRWFELGNTDAFFLLPPCNHVPRPVLISGTTRRKGEHRIEYNVAECNEAIGIDWMSRKGLDEAIPPCYSEFLARQIMEASCLTPVQSN